MAELDNLDKMTKKEIVDMEDGMELVRKGMERFGLTNCFETAACCLLRGNNGSTRAFDMGVLLASMGGF